MANITLHGNKISTIGSLPGIGTKAPDFLLTDKDLNDKKLSDFSGKYKILNIVPSLDTGVCAQSARVFNKEVTSLTDTVVLTISKDLPFAQKRFCAAEGTDQIVTLSEMRNTDFGKKYGVTIADGALAGIFSRAIVLLDKNDTVLYTEQVPEIGQEPDYTAVLSAIKNRS